MKRKGCWLLIGLMVLGVFLAFTVVLADFPVPPDDGNGPEPPVPEPETVLDPEMRSEEICRQGLQDLGFSQKEIERMMECDLRCLHRLISWASGSREEFERVFYGYSIEPLTLLPSYPVGDQIVFCFYIRSNATGELVGKDIAKKLNPNLTVGWTENGNWTENGKQEIIILDPENRDICLLIDFDEETSQFCVRFNTGHLKPGGLIFYIGTNSNFCQPWERPKTELKEVSLGTYRA